MNTKPLLTVLSFSGGKQSSCLLWMIILGKIQRPDNLLVLNADPGMENSGTYKYIQMMRSECEKVGIDIITVPGGNLYEDIVNLKTTTKTRLDNPPYWIKNPDGSKGRLRQSCTQKYKIIPMDRYMRQYMEDNFGIPMNRKRIGNNIVEKWIGFTYSEVLRIKPSPRKYFYFRYPLIEMKMKNDDVISFFNDNGLPIPPRSVCNACFANGLTTFKEMYENRKSDWEQAVRVDESIRDWSQIKVRGEVFVSKTLIPLRDLEITEFSKDGDLENEYSCDSGYCFI